MTRTMRFTAAVMLILTIAAGAWAGNTALPLTSANAQKEETTFGDLAADALCEAAGTSIALIPAVSFKSGLIPPGPVTVSNVSALLTQPTESWAVVRLTGAQLQRTLARSISRAPMPNAGFLQVSGITLTYNPNAGRRERIVSLMVSGSPVDLAGQYEVVMPISLAKGGSGYFQIFGEDNIIRTGQDQMAALIVRYVDGKGTVTYTGQGRIVVAR